MKRFFFSIKNAMKRLLQKQGWRKVGERLAKGWRKVGERLEEGWRKVGERLEEGWRKVGYDLQTRQPYLQTRKKCAMSEWVWRNWRLSPNSPNFRLSLAKLEIGEIGDCLQTQQLLFGKLETISNPAKLLRKFGEIDCGCWKLLPKLPNYCVNRVWRKWKLSPNPPKLSLYVD